MTDLHVLTTGNGGHIIEICILLYLGNTIFGNEWLDTIPAKLGLQ